MIATNYGHSLPNRTKPPRDAVLYQNAGCVKERERERETVGKGKEENTCHRNSGQSMSYVYPYYPGTR